jgi:aminoglycoside phosphotransferase (APT) family kinase protein
MEGNSMDSQQLNSGTIDVRKGQAFDEVRLDLWMRKTVDGYEGPLHVSQFKGGQSNPTYKLSTPGRDYVLRRKPPGALASGAHAVDREARVLKALGKVDFPVARLHGLCTDDSVIGTWFYVMEFIAGRVIWDPSFPGVPREQRSLYFDAMNDVIARLHMLNPADLDLADYGRAGNYFERQMSRWARQYAADVLEAGREPHLERLLEWLPARIPADDSSALVHGDFRCDNVIFHQSEPRILAVLDWELSTLGHPLADFCYHLMMYRMPSMVIGGLLGANIEVANIPREADYVAAYCRRVGRKMIPTDELKFYISFSLFRLATIIHGISARITRGTASSAHAREMVKSLGPLSRLAWEQAQSP